MTTTAANGTLETRDDQHVLRFERRLAHPVERVWAALTEPAQVEQWLAAAEIDLVEGGRVQLRWLNVDDEGHDTVATGTITTLEPPHVIEFDTDVHGLLRWEVRADGAGSVLTFTATVPAPNDYLMMSLAGWHIHLEHLDDALDGRVADWPNWYAKHYRRWAELHSEYARYGTLEIRDGRLVLRFERNFSHPVERVWAAITEPDELKQWFPGSADMTELDRPHVVALAWKGESVRMELRPLSGNTVLVLTHVFDDANQTTNHAAGWHASLDALALVLADTADRAVRDDLFAELIQTYRDRAASR